MTETNMVTCKLLNLKWMVKVVQLTKEDTKGWQYTEDHNNEIDSTLRCLKRLLVKDYIAEKEKND